MACLPKNGQAQFRATSLPHKMFQALENKVFVGSSDFQIVEESAFAELAGFAEGIFGEDRPDDFKDEAGRGDGGDHFGSDQTSVRHSIHHGAESGEFMIHNQCETNGNPRLR